jgi:hypothetical protein
VKQQYLQVVMTAIMTKTQTRMIDLSTTLQHPQPELNRVPPLNAALRTHPDPISIHIPLQHSNHDLEAGNTTKEATNSEIKEKILARRVFHATLVFGVLTLVYETVSLLPAFDASSSATKGVVLQAKSEADSRQALEYSFLQECENRKVSDYS